MGSGSSKVDHSAFHQLNDPSVLIGRWHVMLTNSPMWLKGDKLRPRITFQDPMDTAETNVLWESVDYTLAKGGNQEFIEGVDIHNQDGKDKSHLSWSGSGWMALVSKEWYVVYLDRVAGVAAFYFEPSRVEVLVKDPKRSKDDPAVVAAKTKLASVTGLQGLTENMEFPAGWEAAASPS